MQVARGLLLSEEHKPLHLLLARTSLQEHRLHWAEESLWEARRWDRVQCDWEERHANAVFALSEKDIQKDMNRRRPGNSKFVSQRKESDKIEILSGVFNGRTTGTPISILIANEDKRSRDYESIKNKFRPGHADFTYFKKYGIRDYRGGGRQSARETASRVAAGAIAKTVLKNKTLNLKNHSLKENLAA